MSPLVNRKAVGTRPRGRLSVCVVFGLACLALTLPSTSVEAKRKGRKSKANKKSKPKKKPAPDTMPSPKEMSEPIETSNAGEKSKAKEKPIAKVKEKKNKSGGKEQSFDFTGLSLGGSVRTPQLLYFLDRASEELKRASLERRSFVPEMVLSISEEGL